jgi:glycerophosphoryl diester phosphodiesterase
VVVQKDSGYGLPNAVTAQEGIQIWPQSSAILTRDTAGAVVVRGVSQGFAVVSVKGTYPLAWIAVTEASRRDPILVGHHGVASLAPENTLSGVLVACERQLPGVEVDVRFTRDSVPVLIHDRDISRTSNGIGNVDQMTLAQLREFDFGSWFGKQFVGEPIPTLDEFFTLVSACSFDVVMLDVKAFAPRSLDNAFVRIGQAAGAAGMLSKLYIYYSDAPSLARAKVLLPSIHTILGGAAADSSLVAEALTRHFDFVGLPVDGYRNSRLGAGRLAAAGIGMLVHGLSYPLDPNDLDPFPAIVITDWGWRRSQ